jgi:two-component system, chemotaxis family, chemotaxis protein CheY
MQNSDTACLLVIEDDAQERKLFRRKFADTAYEIIEASNGKEGLAVYRDRKPDLVVTDLIMPEMEGIETIMNLKRVNPAVKIIAVSGGGGSSKEDNLEVARYLGARYTFTKPIDWPALKKTVQEMLT